MVPGLWKPRQKPTAVEGSVASCLCSLCLQSVWAMEIKSCFFGRTFPLEQQPGGPAVWPCLSFPSPSRPVWMLSQPWEGMAVEDTRWQQRAACAERAGRCPHCRVFPWPHQHRRPSSPLSLRPLWAVARGAMGAAREWDTPPCPGGGGGRLSLGVSGDSSWVRGIQRRDGKGCSGVLAHPLPLGIGLGAAGRDS